MRGGEVVGCKHMITYISNRRRSGGVSHRVIDAPVPRVGDGATRAAAAGRRPPGAGAEGGGSPADRPEAGVTDDAGLETRAGERTVRAARGWGPRGLAEAASARGRGAPPGARRSPGRTVVRTLRTSETAMSREILVRYLHTYSTGVTRPSALKPRPLTL